MNFCSNCGTKLEESGICVNCNQKLTQNLYNDFDDNEIEKNKRKKLKKSKILAWISFILALAPILLTFGSILFAEEGSFSGLCLIIFYAWSFPGIVISFVCGIISLIIEKNRLAFYSVIIDAFPLIIFFVISILLKLL